MTKTVSNILLDFDPKKENILSALKKISVEFGYVGEKEAESIAEYFELPLSQIFETASFYDLLMTEKQPGNVIQVCFGPSCTLGKNHELVQEIENYFRIKMGDENNPNLKLERMSCVGRCDEGPVVRINGKLYTRVNKAKLHKIITELGI